MDKAFIVKGPLDRLYGSTVIYAESEGNAEWKAFNILRDAGHLVYLSQFRARRAPGLDRYMRGDNASA